MWNPNPSLLREKLRIGNSLLMHGLCQGWGVWWDCILAFPTHFGMGIYFLICLVCRSCPASFWISFRGNCSRYSCTYGTSMEGGELWSLLGHLYLIPLLNMDDWELLYLQGQTDSSSVPSEVEAGFKNCGHCWFKYYCNFNCNVRGLFCIARSFPYESFLHSCIVSYIILQ